MASWIMFGLFHQSMGKMTENRYKLIASPTEPSRQACIAKGNTIEGIEAKE